MKCLLFLLVSLSFCAGAKPLEVMNTKLAQYKETNAKLCLPGETGSLDDGLFIDVTCSFNCKGGAQKIERVKGSFIPKELGLYPGNGSSNQNTIWSAVGISIRVWSQEICLSKAADGCHGIKLVEGVDVTELESGKWNLKKFPGCHEQTITLSPFDESSGSSRMNSLSSSLLSSLSTPEKFSEKPDQFHVRLKGLSVDIPFAEFNSKSPCQKKIKAKLCFGDCIDLKSEKYQETLGTSDPLGKEEVEVCGDQFFSKVAGQNLSDAVKKQLCEDYFWNSLILNGKNLMASCAAIRGEVSCEGL